MIDDFKKQEGGFRSSCTIESQSSKGGMLSDTDPARI